MKTYYASIKDGKLVDSIMDRIAKESPEGRCIEITVNLKDCKRTVDNNPYYKTCVAKIARELKFSKQQVEDIIKYRFLKEAITLNGEIEYYIKNSLSKKEFNKFIEELGAWTEEMGFKLPEFEGESIFDFKPI